MSPRIWSATGRRWSNDGDKLEGCSRAGLTCGPAALSPAGAARLLEHCEVLIFAHNEAGAIERTIRQVLTQEWGWPTALRQVLVVSTASTDGTDEIVRRIAAEDARVILLALPERRGKVFDVNEAVQRSSAPVLVLMDADVELSPLCLPALVNAMADQRVGIAVAWRQVRNPGRGAVNLVARLAAEVQNPLDPPHAGQVLAIRREIVDVDIAVPVDDAYQEYRAVLAGLAIVRAPEAVVISRGPTTGRDYIAQHRRVLAQQLVLERHTGYRPSTRSWAAVVRAVWATEVIARRRRYDALVAAFVLDGVARVLARCDLVRRRSIMPGKSSRPRSFMPERLILAYHSIDEFGTSVWVFPRRRIRPWSVDCATPHRPDQLDHTTIGHVTSLLRFTRAFSRPDRALRRNPPRPATVGGHCHSLRLNAAMFS